MSDVFYRGTGSNAGRPVGPHDPTAGHPYFGPDQGINFDDLSTGQPAPKAWPGTLTFEALRARVDATFSPNSQRHNEVMLALAGLKAALDDLAAHGQNLAVIDAPPPIGARNIRWPFSIRSTATKSWRRRRKKMRPGSPAGDVIPTLEAKRSGPKAPAPGGIFASYWAAPRESDLPVRPPSAVVSLAQHRHSPTKERSSP